MLKKPHTAALIALLAILPGLVSGQAEPALDSIEELALARALLSEQQDRFGAMDARLVEPLEQLADRLMELNRFDEAHELLDRAMQIARIEAGLYTEVQRPLLKKKIENYANRGDWSGARESMEHLLWLYTDKSLFLNRTLIDDLMELSRIHQRALAEDDILFQGYHFRQSAQIKWIAIGVGEALWGETDERLVPIIYEQLRHYHLQTVALWRGGMTSYALRKVAPGAELMRDRSEVDASFYLSGLDLVNRLFSIYAERATPDPEALAMTNVYLADWHILYDKPDLAAETYLQAYQELLAADVGVQLVNKFFGQPMVIPDTEFYASVEAAVEAQSNKIVSAGDSDTYLSFSEWSTALPNVRSPIPGAITDESVDSNFALFSFSLAGVNKASRWFSHRFIRTINMIEQAELLTHYLDSPPAELELLEKLNSLTFRPKLVDGELQQATGILKYHLADR